MPITSHLFLLIFLPLTTAAYYRLLHTPRQKMFFLLAASYLFYAVAGWQFIPVLLGLSLATYLTGKWNHGNWGILLNLGALILFKYWNFGIGNANAVLSALDITKALPLLRLGLPLGLSFFVFKHIGYLIDLRQKRYEPANDFWSFATFSAYFPQISAGPISNYKETAGQFESLPSRLENDQLVTALIYISYGLAKKILIADTIGALMGPSINQPNGFSGLIPAWYLVIAYAAQLYFDFSGYTDIVLGASTLFGIRLPQNFNNPYLALNPAEFWERWHMSLSTWFRYYLFFPLSRTFLRRWGGDRREIAQYSANLITMTLIGLWHGAGWNFILWGFYHGILLNLVAVQKRMNWKLPVALQRGVFLLAILFGWALFMSNNVPYVEHIFRQLFGFGGLGSRELILKLAASDATLVLIFAIPVAFSGMAEAANALVFLKSRRRSMVLLGTVAAICLLLIQSAQSFIYIQF